MSSRNLELFNDATKDLIVFIKDVQIEELDEIDCRIVRFGQKNVINWKPRMNKNTGMLEPQKPTDNLRIYLYVYEFRQAKNNYAVAPELANKFITINPQIKWLSDLKALQTSLKVATQDAERIFKHKITIKRQQGSFVSKEDGQKVKYAFLTFSDRGPDKNYDNDEISKIGGDHDDGDHSNGDRDDSDHGITDRKVEDNAISSDITEPVAKATLADTSELGLVEKITKFLESASTIEEMTISAKDILLKTSNQDVKNKIIYIFNSVKASKLSSMVIESGDYTKFTSRAAELAAKYIKTDNIQMRTDLLEYAKIMSDSYKKNSDALKKDSSTPSVSDESILTDDIPF